MFFPNQMSFGPPFGSTINQGNVNIANPWATYAGGNPIPGLASAIGIGLSNPSAPFPTAGNYVTFPLQNFKALTVNQWNLSVQRQVSNWLLTANYLGNSQIHLTTSEAGNPAQFLGLGACTLQVVNAAGNTVNQNYPTCSTTGNQNQRRVRYLQNPQQGQYYAGIGNSSDGGTGSYNGLYFSAQKSLSRGISIQTNYTWSHCISDVVDQQTTANGTNAIPGNRRAYRSNCAGSDLRHLFVLNMVAATPRFNNRLLRAVASDWQIAPIIQLKSSQFFTVTSGTDRALTTAVGQTGNLIAPGTEYPPGQSVDRWLDRNAFGLPALGSYGTLGYNNFKGPGTIQINLGLTRTFRIRETQSVQLRGEAFNLPNHLNAAVPVSTLNSGNFGQIISDISGNNGVSPGNQRIIQLALKYVF